MNHFYGMIPLKFKFIAGTKCEKGKVAENLWKLQETAGKTQEISGKLGYQFPSLPLASASQTFRGPLGTAMRDLVQRVPCSKGPHQAWKGQAGKKNIENWKSA